MPGKLRVFSPFDLLPADLLILAASRVSVAQYADGDPVIAQGSLDDSDYFLLGGRVALTRSDGRSRCVTSGTADARAPISPLRPSLYAVAAIGVATCVKMARAEIEVLRSLCVPPRTPDPGNTSCDSTAIREYMSGFRRALHTGKVSLPSVPDIALRVRRAATDKNAGGARIARIIGVDPGITAKLLKVANSPIYRARMPIERLADAIARIGLHTVTELVIFFSLTGAYRSQNRSLQRKLIAVIEDSLRTSALAAVIAARSGRVDPDRSAMAGLMYNIGSLPIYGHAATNPVYNSNPDLVDRVVSNLGAEVGALIAENWLLGERMVTAVKYARQWDHDAGGKVAPVDAVIAARYHHELTHGGQRRLPKPEFVPAFRRLFGSGLTPELSMDIIAAGKARFHTLLSAIGS